jgi:hypothetical protein
LFKNLKQAGIVRVDEARALGAIGATMEIYISFSSFIIAMSFIFNPFDLQVENESLETNFLPLRTHGC